MELISLRPSTGEQDLKQELFLRTELERLVAKYKLKLCGDGRNSVNHGTNQLLERRRADISEEQRGQFYDVYMKKREVKLREEWQAKVATKEEEDMGAVMETLVSIYSWMMGKGKVTEPSNEHSGQINSRKLSSSSNVASSTSQRSGTAKPNPTTRSTNLASLRKENTEPSKGTERGAALQRSIARSRSSRDSISLIKDIRASRSQSLRKNSVSLGEPKDFIFKNSDRNAMAPSSRTNLPRSSVREPVIRKKIGTDPIIGLSTTEVRISLDSLEKNLEDSIEMLKEGNEHLNSMSSCASLKSSNHRFGSRSKLTERSESRNPHLQNLFHSSVQKTSDLDSSVGSLCFDPVMGDSNGMNQYQEGKIVRLRKKWGRVERPFPADDVSTHSTMTVTKGIKRFLKFGNRGNGVEIHDDEDNGHDSRMGHIPSFECE